MKMETQWSKIYRGVKKTKNKKLRIQQKQFSEESLWCDNKPTSGNKKSQMI